MKRDLKINFYILEEITEEIKKYKSALDEMEESSSNMVKMLQQNTSEAITELEELYTNFTVELKKTYTELEDLYTILSSYTSEMQAIIKPGDKNKFTRVDRNDIYFNMQSIIGACVEVGLLVRNRGTVGLSNLSSFIKSDDEKAKEEENYRRLETIWGEVIPRYTRQLNIEIEALNGIYTDKIIPFENTDDEFNTKVRMLELKYTSFWEGMGKQYGEKLKSIGDVLKGFGSGIVDMVEGIWNLGKGIVRYSAAAVVLELVPPSCPKPKWADDIINKTNEEIVAVLKNPGLVIEGLSQGISDAFEEEGAAYCTGYAAGSIVGIKEIDKLTKLAKLRAPETVAEAISKLKYTLKYSIDELAYQIKRVVSIGDETVVDLGNGITYAIREADDVAEAARPAYREVIQGIWKYSGKTADEIADFYLSKVASKTKVSGKFSGSPSEILRAELKDAGVTTPPYANQAHHIIPEGMDIPELNEARAIMEIYGVDLNSASNGVFLPNAQNLPHAGSATVHSGSHTAEYARYVANAIKRANPTSAADITEVLNRLRKELLNGTLKLNSL